MATNPKDSTPTKADQLTDEQLAALAALTPDELEQLANLSTEEREQLAELVPAEPQADPTPDTSSVVIDANGTAWEDTEATRNERASS